MSTERPNTPVPQDMFGGGDREAPRIAHRDKLAELRRELAMRRNVYPRLVEQSKISQATADRQLAALEAVVADYDVEPWPQTRELVREWRPKAETLTVLGVRAARMHRDELLALLAFSVDLMRKAGLLEAPTNPQPPEGGQ